MSFQGDVAGIGLGELLQGLARGGKDGVLTLFGDNLAAAIGLQGGLLYLLESPEETEDEWRRRADCAWANAPDPDLDLARRTAIARAERMETVFRMLEAPNLHFRFEPGPLPLPRNARMRRGAVYALDGHSEEGSPWGVGMGVESVLLEHARISDEAGGSGSPERHDVPVAVAGVEQPMELHGFLAQCDGHSTVGEIADRLACPARQCQGTVSELVKMGVLRLAESHELLGAARSELEQTRHNRTASRIESWLHKSPPGPPMAHEVDQLIALWESGQVRGVLEILTPSLARQLVRRLDIIDSDLGNRLDRWEDLARVQTNDSVTRFHCAALRAQALLSDSDYDGDGHEVVMECLRIARTFAEKQASSRARTTLRIAASTQPTAHQVRVELGARMIEHGMRSEGAAWMLEAAKALVADQDLDRAAQVLGLLLKGVPEHREAQTLLNQTRQILAKARKRRRHGVVGLSAALAISLVAFVQFHAKQERDKNFAEVTDAIENPTLALQLLDKHFAGDRADRTVALRSALEQRQQDQDRANRDAWIARYDQVATETAEGEPVAAYELLQALPPTPRMESGMSVRWEKKDALLAGLLKRFQDDFDSVPEGIEATEDQLKLEAKRIRDANELATRAEAEKPEEFQLFSQDLVELRATATERRAARQVALERETVRRIQEGLDKLLASARYFRESGQLEEAVATYDELLAQDANGQIADLFGREIDTAREQLEGSQQALTQAQAGQHDDALASLEAVGLDPTRIELPWRVDSEPPGAQVKLPDGKVHTTPFVLKTTADEQISLEFTLEDCEPQTLEVDRPGDVTMAMHRQAERQWQASHRVEAVPVAVGEDHIVADRGGQVARLTPEGEIRWEIQLETLGGIGRTPQFLNARPGFLLILSEDGDAWLCNAEDGSLEGPIKLGAPVLDGPQPNRGSLMATFNNGTYAIWDDQLEPAIFPAGSRTMLEIERSTPYDEGNPSIRVLRAGRGLDPELASDWTEWRAEVHEDRYVVRRAGEQAMEFTIRRNGKWAFLAWEAPNVFMPAGRLWISDGDGLRGFLPVTVANRPVDAPAGPAPTDATSSPAPAESSELPVGPPNTGNVDEGR